MVEPQALRGSDAGFLFIETLTNIERASDQCSNIGLHILAVENRAISNNRHAYLHTLHHGDNEVYQSDFQRRKEQYLSRLTKDRS